MRKIKFGVSLATVVVALASCTPSAPTEFMIKGTVADSTFNGQTVYLSTLTTNKRVDSTIVENGHFEFKGVADTTVYRIDLDRMRVNFIGENNVINVEMGQPSTFMSTGINKEYAKFVGALGNALAEYQNTYEVMREKIKDDRPALLKAMEPSVEKYRHTVDSITNKYIGENKDNMIGAMALLGMARDKTLQELDSLIKEVRLSDKLPGIKAALESKIAEDKTSPGKMFVNFEGTTLDGKPTSLADYVGKGNYVLVDFWASWCGPCRREIPNLKAVYDKYKDKGFVVLGVNVWDKEDAYKEAVEEEGMTWPSMYASHNETATNLSGIQGIPTIILFVTDGTILDRSLRGEAIMTEISKLYQK